MSDPSETDTPRRFEPPPWEREQFEELKRRREAEAVARAAEETEWARQIEESRQTAAEAAAVMEGEQPAAAPKPAASAAPRPPEAGAKALTGGEVDDRVTDALLLQLQAEDPPAVRPVKAMGVRMAYVTVVGTFAMLVVTIANLVVFQRTNAAVYGFGAAIFATLAIFTGGVAAWLYIRAMK